MCSVTASHKNPPHRAHKKLQPLSPGDESVAISRSVSCLKALLFKILVFVVVLVTDVRGLPDKSFERNKFCVEIHNIDFLLLYNIY